MAAGALGHAHGGAQTYVVLSLAGTFGYLLGALAGWAIGARGGRALIERHGRWLHLTPERFARAERWFGRFGPAAVFFGRLTPVVRSFISIPAGALGTPLGPYTALTLAGSAIWCFGFAAVGWAVGGSYESVHHAFRYADVAAVALLAAVVHGLLIRRRRAAGVAAAVLAAVLVSAGGAPEAQAAPASHVVVIVMENKSYGQVIGSRGAPYTNRLARRYGLATASYGIRHPSLPNYLALTGGSTFGISSDCTDCHVGARNIADQLEAAQRSWGAYLQGLPRPCFLGAGSGRYAKKHNPLAYYDDIAGNPARCAHLVPASRLDGDLRAGRLPSFAFLSPDLCNSTHDCGVGTGDRYLARVVPRVLRGLGPHGFLVLTYDEGESSGGCCQYASGGRIVTIVAGPDVKRGARLRTPVDHYGTLRTIEDAFGLPPLGRAACGCSGSLRPLFRRAPHIA
jgi:membrane protein DedA with SNARE-associated domain